MPEQIKCKRIIDGRTYNTETATRLWSYEPDEGPPIEDVLYKNRYGAYFLYYLDEHFSHIPKEVIKPLEPNEAQEWLEKYCWKTEVLEAEFGEMPEAGDPEARITLRVPQTLRIHIAALAKDRQQSLNAWILRCVEQCAANAEREDR